MGVIVLAVPFLLGLILFIRGLRGRRVDDHPLCRKCGFDLTGKPEDSTRCSECGADVSSPRNVRIGHRRRSLGALITGSILLLMFLLPAGVLTVGHVRGVDWQKHKPAWLLMQELKDPNAYGPALKEFNLRLADGKLNNNRIHQIVAHALQVQATTQKWDPAWGDFVERAHAMNKLSEAQWQKYFEQAIILELAVRQKVRRGDALQPQITVKARFGTDTTYVLRGNTRDDVIWVGGIKLPQPGAFTGYSATIGSGGSSGHGSSVNLRSILPQLPDGPTELRLIQLIRISTSHDEKVPPILEFEKTLTGQFDLRPASESTVTAIDDPSFKSQLEKLIVVDSVKVRGGYLQMQVGMGPTPLPVGVSFSIYVLADGREWKMSSVAWPAGRTNSFWHVSGQDRNFPQHVTKCDVILRPDIVNAAGTVDVVSIWNGELKFENVPVAQEKK